MSKKLRNPVSGKRIRNTASNIPIRNSANFTSGTSQDNNILHVIKYKDIEACAQGQTT